jgi:circadian clock protein KaiB
MSRSRKPRVAPGPTAVTVVVMRLYIAGSAPNSVQAVANLQAICQEHLKGVHTLEVVDILEHPLRAMADGVLVTPSLTKLSPLPAANVFGNLNDKSKVLLALGIKGKTA